MTTPKTSASVAHVQLSSLTIGKRHRAIDKFKVASLAKSMGAIGLQQPISVHVVGDAVHLVAGLHRVKAAMSLGWDSIDAAVVELDELDRELWEIDENLQRAGLSAAEEREHFKRRKELWAKRAKSVVAHDAPKPKSGPKGGRPKGFAAETAAATGLSKSQINRKLAKSKPAVKRAAKAATEKTAKERLDDVFDVGADGDDLAIPSFLDRKATAEPAPKETARAPLSRKPTKLETQHIGVIKARRLHVDEAVNVGVDVETEIELFADELRLAARKRAGNGAADIDAKERRTA